MILFFIARVKCLQMFVKKNFSKKGLTNGAGGCIIISEIRNEVNKMTKNEMITEVIRRYGFENKWTIWFCEVAEILNKTQLQDAFILVDANCYCDCEED